MPVDPHSNEIRYAMSLVGYQVGVLSPRTVRIASRSSEMVRAVVRNLVCAEYTLLVETPELQAAIAASLGVAVELVDERGPAADCAVFPFATEEGIRPAGEASIVVVCHNALSYKSLLRPGRVHGTAARTSARLRREYDVRAVAGLFSPVSIGLLALARLADRLSPALHFRLEGMALSRLIDVGPLWRVSYVVVLAGRRIG